VQPAARAPARRPERLHRTRPRPLRLARMGRNRQGVVRRYTPSPTATPPTTIPSEGACTASFRVDQTWHGPSRARHADECGGADRRLDLRIRAPIGTERHEFQERHLHESGNTVTVRDAGVEPLPRHGTECYLRIAVQLQRRRGCWYGGHGSRCCVSLTWRGRL
jgi:hypothetical protein